MEYIRPSCFSFILIAVHRTGYILIALSLLIVQVANAQTVRPKASNYVMPTDVQAVGGGEAAKSTFYILDDTIGEANIGAGRSDNYDLQAGYRQTSDNAYIAMTCDDTADMGIISFSGQANGSATCTVTTDADAGYSLSWRAGTNNTNGLVGHWKMDETTGTTAYDSSGNQNDGAHQNTPTISTDIASNYFSTRSLEFNGTNEYVNASTFSHPTGGPVTVSFWNYVTTANVQVSSAFDVGGDDTERFQAHAPWSDNTLYWDYGAIAGNGRITANYTAYRNKWTHITLVSAGVGGNFKAIYLDGKLVASSTTSDGPDIPLSGLAIGRSDLTTPAYHKGNIDDFRIYDRVLSYAEVQSLASKAPPGALTLSGSQVTHIAPFGVPFTGGLVGHWKMDEIPSGGVAADSSGYGKDGTLTGATGTNNAPQPSTVIPTGANHITARSLDFDGTDDVFEAAPNALYKPASTVTVAGWFKQSGAATDRVVMEWDGGSVDPYRLRVDNAGTESFAFTYSTPSVSNQAVTWVTTVDTNWHHVVGVFDGSIPRAYLYVDGVERATFTPTETTLRYNAFGEQSVVAGTDGTNFYTGNMDDLRVYNRALTAAEVAALYGTPQAWTVAATDARWGGRVSSTSTDVDAKWGTDNSTDKWLNVGEGSYPLVVRNSRTSVSGSTELLNFRAEIGATKIQSPGVYKAAIVLTAAAL